ncbi:MAG: NADH-quinone oxidoreductase subunit C [Candidatus Aegiribacteria sp.]
MDDRLLEQIELAGFEVNTLRMDEGYLHVKVDPARVLELLLMAKRRFGHGILQLISAVDRIEDGMFQLTWILESAKDGSILMISSDHPREGCALPTLGDVWPAAVFFERELHEMFGIDFPGNERQEEDFLLEGWRDLPPMRRDFDTLKYSMETFGERREREHTDPREHVAERTGEWNTPVPAKETDR